MLRCVLLIVIALAVILAAPLPPEEEKCIPVLSAKLEAEQDAELQAALRTALGKYLEGEAETTKSIVSGLTEERKARFRDHYLIDE
ncbi:hypothetical protein PMAYCL1PPCAC_15960, partial [Pristionchus mayeri]